MKRLYMVIFAILFVLSTGFAIVQESPEVELTATKVAGTIYMIHGTDEAVFSGGNIAVSTGEDGVVMIDAKMAPLTDKLEAAITKIGGNSPKFIVNTHVHGDHIGGNAAFGNKGTIVAHTNVRKRMIDESKEKAGWPVITFDESLSIHMNSENMEVLHYPKGHTNTDAIIFFNGSNVVHMGDHFFNGVFPYVDLNSGGTVQGYKENVKDVLERLPDDAKIVPGHGALATKQDLTNFYRMLHETTTIVTDAMKSGKSLEEITAAGLPEEWQGWSGSFITTERWIKTIYDSYLAGMKEG